MKPTLTLLAARLLASVAVHAGNPIGSGVTAKDAGLISIAKLQFVTPEPAQ